MVVVVVTPGHTTKSELSCKGRSELSCGSNNNRKNLKEPLAKPHGGVLLVIDPVSHAVRLVSSFPCAPRRFAVQQDEELLLASHAVRPGVSAPPRVRRSLA